MKKLFLVLFCLLIPFSFFAGCKKDLKKESKNLTTYEINGEIDFENKKFNASQSVSYLNKTGQNLSEICFHLYPNAFREGSTLSVVSPINKSSCYPNGNSFGKIDIASVKNKNSNLKYEICGSDANILRVFLEKEVENKKRTEIQIEFSVAIPNCNHRFGYNDKTINLGNFYPIACVYENGNFVQDGYNSNGDPFYSECASYTVSITAPKNLVVAGSGNKKTKTNGDKTTSTFVAPAVRDVAFVIGQLQSISCKAGKINVTYYYYDDEKAKQSLETAKKSIETFNKLFGKYPYENYSVVQTKFVQGGMEFPGLVLISDAYTLKEDYTSIIVHETAHQWWYGVVGNNQFSSAWQDEALAEFSTALFFKKHTEYGIEFEKYFENLKTSYIVFEKVYREVLKDLDTSMNRKLNEFNTEPEYTYQTYVKGNLMFKNLYNMVGEKKFLKSLKSYYKTYKFKIATQQNLIDCFSKNCNKNLNEFFASWLNGNVNVNEI